jgi:hypothetical protein
MSAREEHHSDEHTTPPRELDPLSEDYVPPSRCQFCGSERLERLGQERALRCLDCAAWTT